MRTPADTSERVLQMLEQGPMRPEQIRRQLEISRARLDHCLRHLARMGKVAKMKGRVK